MVTPKEIDFLIDKLSLLIGHGLNMALHSVKRSYSDVWLVNSSCRCGNIWYTVYSGWIEE